MKKQVKKFVRSRRYASWRLRKKLQKPLLFASFFGLVMVAYGVSLIFAATTPTKFSLSPTTQTVSPNQIKTVSVSFDPQGNNVRGGSVKVTFDTNRLTFNKATAASNIYPYYITSGTAGTGSYTFTFTTYGTTKQAVNFGTLEFTIKPATGTVSTSLNFAAANTYAYYSNSATHLAAVYAGAAMTIQGTPAPVKPTVTVSISPASVAYNGSTTVSWTSKDAASCSNNFGASTGTSGSKVVTGLTTNKSFTVTCTKNGLSGSDTKTVAVAAKPGDPPPPAITTPTGGDNSTSNNTPQTPASNPPTEPTVSSSPEQATEPEGGNEFEPGDVVASTNPSKKQFPFKALGSILAGIGLLAGSAYIYATKLRHHKRGLKPATNIHTNLFGGAAAGALSGTWPQTHDEDSEQAIPPDQPETEAYSEPLPEEPAENPTTNLLPPPEATGPHSPSVTESMPAEPEQATAPAEPQLSPADKIAQAALADLAANKPASFQEVLAKEAAASMPKPPQPRWQNRVVRKRPPKDEPKDMFELANEDPENFGSTQLAESYGEETEHVNKNQP